MTTSIFQDDFPPADLAAWRALAEEELKGASFDGLRAQWPDDMVAEPLYAAENAVAAGSLGLPGEYPYARGTRLSAAGPGAAWWLGTEVRGAADAANAALLADLALGAELVVLGLRGPDALRWQEVADLARLFDEVEPRYLRLMLQVDAEAALPAAEKLMGWAGGRGLAAGELHAFFGCDPIGTLARRGGLGFPLEEAWRQAAVLAGRCAAEAPGARALTLSSIPFAAAGAGPATVLACALAGFVETLRQLDRHGLPPAQAAGQIVFEHAVGSEIFLEIANLRALRWLIAKALRALDADDAALHQMHIAFTAEYELTRVDPWVNLLRGTAQVFAAAVAGADGIVALPYDRALGRSDAQARRIALTTQQVLAEESQLGRVVDPAGGSWALDSWTEQLARRAWTLFQAIEREGGLVASLLSGAVQRRIALTAGQRRQDLEQRRRLVVGVSAFADLEEVRPARTPMAPPAADPELVVWIEPLPILVPARPFEELRLAADAARELGVTP